MPYLWTAILDSDLVIRISVLSRKQRRLRASNINQETFGKATIWIYSRAVVLVIVRDLCVHDWASIP